MDPIQLGGEMNELFSTKMCSPMMIYLGVVVTSGLSVYLTRSYLKRHNTYKMDNLYNLYSLNELKFIIVFGLVLLGLCQYNKTSLAWIFLLFPVIYLVIQNLIIHIHISSAIQSSPKEVDAKETYFGGAAPVVPKPTVMPPPQQQPPQVPPQVPVTMSQPGGTPLNGSNEVSGSPVQGNYAYF